MYKKVFIDTNIIADMYDDKRVSHLHSVKLMELLFSNESVTLFTSCDIITTLYYILSKSNRKDVLSMIEEVNDWCKVIEFGNKEIRECCTLMKQDTKYKDLEDTIQYIMAKKVSADLILSNDKGFVSDDIELRTSKSFFDMDVRA